MEEKKIQQNLEIKEVLNQPYKYGFKTIIEKEEFPSGINESIIDLISLKKNESSFLKKFRKDAYLKWSKMTFPNWSNLNIEPDDLCPKVVKRSVRENLVRFLARRNFRKLHRQ